MKKKISLILVVVMVLSCLAACGQAKTPAAESTVAPAETVAEGTAAPETETEPVVSGDVELASHFAPGSEQAAVLQGIADAFMAEHPEINVTIQFNGNENFVKMKTRFAANDAPDIIWTSPSDMLWYVQSDLLAPLTDVYNGQNYYGTGIMADDFPYKAVVDMNTVDGEIMALPAELCAGAWYYNKAVFEDLGLSVPATWDEFVANNAKMLEAGISPICADGNVDFYLPWYFTNLAVRLAGLDAYEEILANPDSSLWDNPAFLQAAKMVEEGIVPFFQPGMKGTQYPAANALFAQGQAAMAYCASWFPQEIISITPDDFQYGMFSFPEIEGAKETRTVVEMKANSYVLCKEAKNPEAAKLFLTYLVSKDGLEPLVQLNMLPAISGIDNIPEIQQEVLSIFETAEVGVPIHLYLFDPDYKDWASAVIFPANNQLCYGEITAEQFIEAVKTNNDAFFAAKK